MKATIKLLSFFMLAIFVVACGPKGKKVEATDAKEPATTTTTTNAQTFNVNKGVINWTGSKLAGSSHTGIISVALGDLQVKGNNLMGGQFKIDMGSIENTDVDDAEMKQKLEGHLMSEDFFDVAKYPEATFVITEVQAVGDQEDVTHNVTGNLTMKGKSKSITIPANVAIVGNKLTAVTPAFKIDRTDWGVEYGSGSLFDLAKDKVINDEIALVLNLEATAVDPVQ